MPSHTHRQRSRGGDGNIAQHGDGIGAEFLGTSGASLGDTFPTGGGKSHNHGNTGSSTNMPPYLVVYMWKRTS